MAAGKEIPAGEPNSLGGFDISKNSAFFFGILAFGISFAFYLDGGKSLGTIIDLKVRNR